MAYSRVEPSATGDCQAVARLWIGECANCCCPGGCRDNGVRAFCRSNRGNRGTLTRTFRVRTECVWCPVGIADQGKSTDQANAESGFAVHGAQASNPVFRKPLRLLLGGGQATQRYAQDGLGYRALSSSHPPACFVGCRQGTSHLQALPTGTQGKRYLPGDEIPKDAGPMVMHS